MLMGADNHVEFAVLDYALEVLDDFLDLIVAARLRLMNAAIDQEPQRVARVGGCPFSRLGPPSLVLPWHPPLQAWRCTMANGSPWPWAFMKYAASPVGSPRNCCSNFVRRMCPTRLRMT